MGREIKRVSLDFDWPLKQVWQGFLNPYWEHRQGCEACGGSGYGPEAKKLYEQWYGNAPFDPAETGSKWLTPDDEAVYLFAKRNVERDQGFYTDGGFWSVETAIHREASRLCQMWNRQWNHHLDADDVQALLDGGRLYDLTHTFVQGQGWQSTGYIPTPEEVNRWNILSMGHDSINAWVCVEAKAKRLGYELRCSVCHGDGDLWPSEEIKAAYENWEPQEPPEGDGWQVWETVTEGSPISPVFATSEEVENWLIKEGYSEGAAEQFIKAGWVPSMVMEVGPEGADIRPDIESLNMG